MRSTVKYFYVRFLQQIKLKAKLTGNENNARTVSGCFRDVESRGHSRGQPASCARRWTSVLLNRLIGQSTLSDQLTMPWPGQPGLRSPLTDQWSVQALTKVR